MGAGAEGQIGAQWVTQVNEVMEATGKRHQQHLLLYLSHLNHIWNQHPPHTKASLDTFLTLSPSLTEISLTEWPVALCWTRGEKGASNELKWKLTPGVNFILLRSLTYSNLKIFNHYFDCLFGTGYTCYRILSKYVQSWTLFLLIQFLPQIFFLC